MSCAHSFGEYCSECINGLVADDNAARQENQRLTATVRALQERIDKLNQEADEDAESFRRVYARAEAAEAQLTALRGALRAKAEEWRAAVKERGGSGCGCYGKNEMQRQCALELDAMRSSSASGPAALCSECNGDGVLYLRFTDPPRQAYATRPCPKCQPAGPAQGEEPR